MKDYVKQYLGVHINDIEFVGKFYDNHSLSIINRNIATRLAKKFDVYITPLDDYDPQFNIRS